MIKELCTELGLECYVFLPSRHDHGYGLNETSMAAFKEKLEEKKFKPDFLFILDCGSSNEAEILELREMGIEKIVILDHHIVVEERMSKSADALINWHLCDHEEMCTCGEVYQFIRSLRILTKKVNPTEFLSYAAIGTIGDVSPLKGANRIIVKNGLTKYALDHVVGHGLNALLVTSKIDLDRVTQTDIAFKIVPKINAAGRMVDPYLAYYLLVEPDQSKVEGLARELNSLNDDRKKLQKDIEAQALKEVRDHLDRYPHGILLYNPGWPIGVVGIVAARVCETFNKPCAIAGLHKGKIKGSARSFGEIDLKAIMDDCQDMFAKYGGHKLAAGLTLKEDKVAEANERFNEACGKFMSENEIAKGDKFYDAELRPKTICFKTAKMLMENLYPYCNQNNEEPIFKVSNARVVKAELFEPKGWKILRFSCKQDEEEIPFEFMMFTEEFGSEIGGMNADVYFRFPQSYEPNSYGRYELQVVDIVKR
jgi:single-stranded-DNA-specific exonuclease